MSDGYARLPHAILRRRDVSSTAKLVYAFIVDAMRSNGSSWPGRRAIEAGIGVSGKPVTKAVKDLEAVGLIIVKRQGHGRCNIYSLPKTAGESTPVTGGESTPVRNSKVAYIRPPTGGESTP